MTFKGEILWKEVTADFESVISVKTTRECVMCVEEMKVTDAEDSCEEKHK